MAVLWLAVEAAEQLLRSGVFNVNQRSEQYARHTYLMQLSEGKLQSGLRITENTARFERLCALLYGPPDVDLELQDA